MRDLAPDIVRKRFLVEGYYTIDVDEASIKEFFSTVCDELALRMYGEPIIFSPSSGMGKEENAGYDAFVPLIDSGISLYVWSKKKFFSCVFYTCKEIDEKKALDFTKTFFNVKEAETFSF